MSQEQPVYTLTKLVDVTIIQNFKQRSCTMYVDFDSSCASAKWNKQAVVSHHFLFRVSGPGKEHVPNCTQERLRLY